MLKFVDKYGNAKACNGWGKEDMIERRAQFIHELNNICESIVKHGKLKYDEEKMKASFLDQVSSTPENIECIENMEYAMVMESLSYNGKKRKSFGLR